MEVTLVCGAVGSGKTYYVQEHSQRGDLVVDLDLLYMAISGLPMYDRPTELLPFALVARKAIVRRLMQPSIIQRAWVITSNPTLGRRYEYAAVGARIVVLEVPADECIRRVQADERRAPSDTDWTALIRDWWARYKRRRGDVVIEWAAGERADKG